jgi:hypothetical protein
MGSLSLFGWLLPCTPFTHFKSRTRCFDSSWGQCLVWPSFGHWKVSGQDAAWMMQEYSVQQSPSCHLVIQAVHGYCPEYVTTSMARFALSYSSLFIVLYDHKKREYVKASHMTVLRKVLLYAKGVVVTGALHSLYLMYPYSFIQFGASFDRDRWYSWQEIFQWQRLWENLCFASKCCWCAPLALATGT